MKLVSTQSESERTSQIPNQFLHWHRRHPTPRQPSRSICRSAERKAHENQVIYLKSLRNRMTNCSFASPNHNSAIAHRRRSSSCNSTRQFSKKEPPSRMTIDFSDVRFFSSAFFGSLISVRKKLNGHGGTLRLRGMSIAAARSLLVNEPRFSVRDLTLTGSKGSR